MNTTDRSLFFSGIGGSGLSAIARFMAARGNRVSGSDRAFDKNPDHPALDALRMCGITMYPQDGSGVTPQTDMLVFSTAVEPDQPELVKARKLNIPSMTRPDYLAALSTDFRSLAVAGTSGKSTTSGMLAFLMERLGMHPSFIGGGRVKQFRTADNPGNSLSGVSDFLVIEACESDGSIVHYRPEHTIVLNLDLDHHSISETASMFRILLDNTRGSCVLNADDLHLAPFRSKAAATFSLDAPSDYRAENLILQPLESSFTVRDIPFRLSLPGRYNVMNALACIALLGEMGIQPEAVAEVLPAFTGIERRFDIHVNTAEHLVVDDYAHNPHKIASMMQAVQLIRPALCYLFQPHGYGPTRMMKNEYIAAFAENLRASDHLILLPIYYAGGTAQKDISSDEIARGVAVQGKSAESVTTRKEVLDRIAEWQNYIIFGARDESLSAFAASIADKIRQRT